MAILEMNIVLGVTGIIHSHSGVLGGLKDTLEK